MRLTYLVNDILTPADLTDSNADASDVSSINTLITDLS